MKFNHFAIAVILATSRASAWTARSLPHSRHLAAVQLHSTVTDISTEVAGEEATESFRLKFKEGGNDVSPWHDIPLKNDDGSYNMVRHSFVGTEMSNDEIVARFKNTRRSSLTLL